MSISGLFSSDDILYDAPLAHLVPNYVYFWTDIHNLFHFFIYFLVGIHILAILYYQIIEKHKIILKENPLLISLLEFGMKRIS